MCCSHWASFSISVLWSPPNMKGKEPNAKNIVAVDLMVSNTKYTEFYHRIVKKNRFFIKILHSAAFSYPKTWRILLLLSVFLIDGATRHFKIFCFSVCDFYFVFPGKNDNKGGEAQVPEVGHSLSWPN